MRKILWKIGVILMITVVVDRLVALRLDRLHEQNEMDFGDGHLNHYLKRHSPDTLLIGSSRMRYHLDPSVFGDQAYNLSKNGMHIGYQAAVVDLLKQFERLPSKTLILHVEPEDLLAFYNDDLFDDIHSLRYYWGENPFITSMINRKSILERVKYCSALYRHNGRGLGLLTKPSQEATPWPTQTGFDTLGVRLNLAEMQCETAITDTSVNGAVFLEFARHIHAICTEKKIDLICITSPRYCRTEGYRRRMLMLEHQFRAMKIPYMHASDLGMEDDLSLWSDAEHLNANGAKRYSKMVLQWIHSLKRMN